MAFTNITVSILFLKNSLKNLIIINEGFNELHLLAFGISDI